MKQHLDVRHDEMLVGGEDPVIFKARFVIENKYIF